MSKMNTPGERLKAVLLQNSIEEQAFAEMCKVTLEDVWSVLVGRTLPDHDMLVFLERAVPGASDIVLGEWDGESMYEDFENGNTETRWDIFTRYGVPASLYPIFCSMLEQKNNAPAAARRKSIELIEWSLPSLSDAKISQIISLINSPEN